MAEHTNEAGIVWYEGLGFDIGARVEITDSREIPISGVTTGSVVGFDASGPRPGEAFIRVLVQPDGPMATIIALPPSALSPEAGGNLLGLARTVLTGLEQSMRPEQFTTLLTWLTSEQARAMAQDPTIRLQRIRSGNVFIPGLVLPEVVELAAARLGARV
ncbi:hypothetical protein [Candidatus Chloroploca asiatica]|uniref:Uncharacterized protein n=1 Tax=Candidatus Chloroploca asiatica TaxID=1506545 RepID=A0A2H3KHS1_9CHLR|nr:hypothetical protein [Candidatus Chloroploca asiatica]PDV97344.1 hypothetical protein A9Q02_18730 [Candidatus Chloroploca asiatica]